MHDCRNEISLLDWKYDFRAMTLNELLLWNHTVSYEVPYGHNVTGFTWFTGCPPFFLQFDVFASYRVGVIAFFCLTWLPSAHKNIPKCLRCMHSLRNDWFAAWTDFIRGCGTPTLQIDMFPAFSLRHLEQRKVITCQNHVIFNHSFQSVYEVDSFFAPFSAIFSIGFSIGCKF